MQIGRCLMLVLQRLVVAAWVQLVAAMSSSRSVSTICCASSRTRHDCGCVLCYTSTVMTLISFITRSAVLLGRSGTWIFTDPVEKLSLSPLHVFLRSCASSVSSSWSLITRTAVLLDRSGTWIFTDPVGKLLQSPLPVLLRSCPSTALTTRCSFPVPRCSWTGLALGSLLLREEALAGYAGDVGRVAGGTLSS